jgi:hypothetical protein
MKLQQIQRKTYNNKRETIKPGEVMIICDFKENIILGRGPVEFSQEFYHRKQCSVLGCQVGYFNENLKKIKTVNIDFFSDIISKDALFVKDCLRRLLKNIYHFCPGLSEFERIFFWTDVGQHFDVKKSPISSS